MIMTTLAAELVGATGLRGRAGAPLAPHTTMRVGGPADLLVEARSVAALAAALDFARGHAIPVAVLGRGSNLVVADAGVRGLVILNRTADLEIRGDRLVAASGVQLARAATAAGRAGLSGLEFGLAIPGSVGGAVWANAGAHGSEVAAVLETAELIRSDGSRVTVPSSELGLSYRDSRLKHAAPDAAPSSAPDTAAPPAPEIVLTATFLLSPAPPALIAARSDDIRRWRREHQPLTEPSAGSIFRNPPDDSAGRLIDAAGLKGATEGGAMISSRHANFIVNTGRASAADIRRLALRARDEVRARFGVELVFEVEFAGDWSGWLEEA
jgi:UDP-N-acetylmuramate dehydrogenase